MKDTVPGLLFHRAALAGEAPCFFWKDASAPGGWASQNMEASLRELAGVARALEALGAGPGVTTAILSDTRREWVAADLANLCLGGVTVGVYPSLLPHQIAFQLAHSEVRIAIVEDADQAAKVAQIRDQVPTLEAVISLDEAPGLRRLQALAAPEDWGWLEERARAVEPDDVATNIYTSGTTGAPKGAVLTHGNFVTVARASRAAVPTRPGDRSLIFLPLAHSLQRFAVYRGLMEEDSEGWFTTIADFQEALAAARPQVLATVPRMLEKIRSRAQAKVAERGGVVKALFDWAFRVGLARSHCLETGAPVPLTVAAQYAIADRLVFSRIRERLGGEMRCLVSGGAALNPEVARWYHAMGITVLEGWGLTETSAPATANREDDFRFGTVGKAIPEVELRIADDGEILVRGPGIFREYLKNPEASAAALEGGWFHTGDIGTLDDEGFLRITDRKKEILVTAGGKNIPPLPIETRLEFSDFVEKAVVIGSERPYLVALLTPDEENLDAWASQRGLPAEALAARLGRPGVRALFDAAMAAANEDQARFEQVKKYTLLPTSFTDRSGELTPTLKLKRRVINERYADAITALYSG